MTLKNSKFAEVVDASGYGKPTLYQPQPAMPNASSLPDDISRGQLTNNKTKEMTQDFSLNDLKSFLQEPTDDLVAEALSGTADHGGLVFSGGCMGSGSTQNGNDWTLIFLYADRGTCVGSRVLDHTAESEMTFISPEATKSTHYSLAKQSSQVKYFKTFEVDSNATPEVQEVDSALAEWFVCWAVGTYQMRQAFVNVRRRYGLPTLQLGTGANATPYFEAPRPLAFSSAILSWPKWIS
ncbi:unnamed protein product [Sympodiomycopsis kandeliae]